MLYCPYYSNGLSGIVHVSFRSLFSVFFSFKIQHTYYRANNSIEVSIYCLHSMVIYLSKHQFYQHLCHYYASYLRFFLPSEGINLLNLNICWVGVWVCVCLWVQTWGGPSGAVHGRPPGAAGVGGGSSEGRGRCCATDRRGLGWGGPAWATVA